MMHFVGNVGPDPHGRSGLRFMPNKATNPDPQIDSYHLLDSKNAAIDLKKFDGKTVEFDGDWFAKDRIVNVDEAKINVTQGTV